MGFSYEGKKLCCETCPVAGARKVKCPWGYCQAIAQCATCRKDPAIKAKLKEYHKNCKANHESYVRDEQERTALILSGYFVRSAALGADDKGVHVLFDSMTSDGSPITMGFYMKPETYQGFALGKIATYQDYIAKAKELGDVLVPAPNSFHGGGKLMPVSEFMAAVGLSAAAQALINQKMLAEEN